jgi:hypothetical protein
VCVRPRDGRIFAIVSGAVFSALPRLPLRWSAWGGPFPHGSNPEAIAYWPPAQAVLVGDGGGDMFAATSETSGWTRSETGLPVGREAVTAIVPSTDVIYAGLSNGLASSKDGRTWSLDTALGEHPVAAIATMPRGGLAASLDSSGLAVRDTAEAPWRISPSDALGLSPNARVLGIAYDPRSRRLVLGTLIDGLRTLNDARLPARRLAGVLAGNPVNALVFAGHWLFASTNGGIVRLAGAAPALNGR